MGVESTPIPLVCSASWGEGPDYNLVLTPKGHYLLKKLTSTFSVMLTPVSFGIPKHITDSGFIWTYRNS